MFGSMQMAVSRVIKLQHHRIAQVLAMLFQRSSPPLLGLIPVWRGRAWPRTLLIVKTQEREMPNKDLEAAPLCLPLPLSALSLSEVEKAQLSLVCCKKQCTLDIDLSVAVSKPTRA